ncbi:MAG: bifunctional phosphoribosylaminoimidazolecarboxamide formyltransferase/IMP cyclohydrolase [bacterium]|nr:bifunctional phosphoribosylaminoimidazolecarboxamide formyltransferase/IMP cyclohydrolase [bacterium]
MAHPQIKRALVAVYDKTGIVDFARALVDEFGIEIISTGGTAKHLQDADVPVTLVEQITGFPEMLDGRVKTLHPKIHAAILADRDNPEHMRQLAEQGIEPIDMVVVNLYPFEETVAKPGCTFEEAIEMIDIGGPCLLRAAAKNHRHVLIVLGPNRYSEALCILRCPPGPPLAAPGDPRVKVAADAFDTTCCYDAEVARWLGQQPTLDGWPWLEAIFGQNWGALRYGENPHQTAELLESYEYSDEPTLPTAEAMWSSQDDMSFNNYVDANAALGLCAELTHAQWSHACVFVKHTNACGVGVADNALEAYQQAYLGDPTAAMGSILVVNFDFDSTFVDAVMQTYDRWGKAAGAGGFFIEVWVAPTFDRELANLVRSSKKWGERVRLLNVHDLSGPPNPDQKEIRTIAGGMLLQQRDLVGLNEDIWEVVTERSPTEKEMDDLRLAWLICKHTKSNAISICKDGMLIGNGAGQMSRVMSCRIATWLANENGHADQLAGSVAASDAFFPFRDGPDLLLDAGVTAIIQPGGSKRDADTIAACNERGAAMLFTHTRHFKH